ncbi:glutamine-hydrolyzing carbamoyl-phosphate synthase small subunit [Candidatus Daviesbacteria bacterium]|nr:glutamine-hydrolyzing carbamoyl-phosphate synthase small subunit [Candidatus Daviesbacteria bacterium]
MAKLNAKHQARLILKDGTEYEGESFGADINSSGEVVFNTGMAGYPESLTDPSYFGQILVLTYPIIGNYGVPPREFFESRKIWVKGLIVQNYIDKPSHFESLKTLGAWLKEEGIPAISGIDTRALTLKLRYHGVMLGEIRSTKHETRNKSKIENSNGQKSFELQNPKFGFNLFDPNSENVLTFVSRKTVEVYGEGKKTIVLIDCGDKENIIRSFVKRKVKVIVVPWDLNPLKDPPAGGFDGVMVSNGPGDPKLAKETIKNIKELLNKNVPTFGICLGSQLLALASGADTYKLKFGHRGQNQPVLDVLNNELKLSTNKALITSQNHGFAVNTKTLKPGWVEWFKNLNDGTNEGIRHKHKPFMSIQFHPEASPGPVDADYLFDEFLNYL